MNSSIQKLLTSIQITFLIFFFLVLNFFKFPEIWQFKFSERLIERYLHSQDIPREVKGRVFLSDEEIHIAAGYLYAKGASPTEYNFQHPPLIKYLFGISTKFFNTPLPVHVFFSAATIILTYFLALRLLKNLWTTFFMEIIFLIDPLVQRFLNSTLLDPGQNFFILLFLYLSLFHPKKILLQGISLAAAAASKFWPPVAFFGTATLVFRHFFKKDLSAKEILIIGGSSVITFTLVYWRLFLEGRSLFYFLWFQGKVLKYWFNHSISTVPGNSLLLFLTGYFKSWWGGKAFLRSKYWNLLWPISFSITFVYLVRQIKNKQLNGLTFISFLPILYLLYITLQAPFDRYFLVVLPLLYIITTKTVDDIIRKWAPREKN